MPGRRSPVAAIPIARDQRAFTLIELIVVMLVLSLLAAIAIPAFFSQRDKARDAEAKAHLATSQLAIETFAIDNDGTYTGADAATLAAIEGALSGTALTVVSSGADTYQLRVVSDTGNSFFLLRQANGDLARSCDPAGDGGCPTAGTW